MLPALGIVEAARARQPLVNASGQIIAAFELRLHNTIVADNARLASVSCRTVAYVATMPICGAHARYEYDPCRFLRSMAVCAQPEPGNSKSSLTALLQILSVNSASYTLTSSPAEAGIAAAKGFPARTNGAVLQRKRTIVTPGHYCEL
jgi:hypothetical protein